MAAKIVFPLYIDQSSENFLLDFGNLYGFANEIIIAVLTYKTAQKESNYYVLRLILQFLQSYINQTEIVLVLNE